MTLQLARDLPALPFNTRINRFDPKYWTIDFNSLMHGVIIPINSRGFIVPAQWRTNADFMGVRWESKDNYSHEYFRYETDNNYTDTVLAFRSNPAEPDKFTVTITVVDVLYTYRLCPYILNETTNRYEPLDTMYGTGRTYPADVIIPKSEWTNIPELEMTPYKGRTDYVFILDFSDMRIFTAFNGPRLSPLEIDRISFDTLEWSHGLGRNATISSMENIDNGKVRFKIVGAVPGSVLSAGDTLTFLARFRVPVSYVIGDGPILAYQTTPQYSSTAHIYWVPSKTRTFYIKGSNIETIPGTQNWLSATGVHQYFGSPDRPGWQSSFAWPQMPVTSIEQVTPSTIKLTVNVEGSPWENPQVGQPSTYSGSLVQYVTLTLWRWGEAASEHQITVSSATGFGTGEWVVEADFEMPGDLIACDAFYSRYLKVTSPADVTNSTKYFVDMTTTGERTTIQKKHHPQPEHGLMMTSGFDDGYNLSPHRQVEQVYNLGYRGHWTKYQGMSHYFNGRTAWMDKETGQIVAPGRTENVAVLFAGDQTLAAQFLTGMQPNRGADEFMRRAAQLFGVAEGQVEAINGTVGSTSVDRAAAFDPTDDHYDPDVGLPGGRWWWDLDNDRPGPALLACINKVHRDFPPSAIVWGISVQDIQALQFPGTRPVMPTNQRYIDATKKVFAYFRAQWGEHLPIIVQGVGMVWGLDDEFSPAGTPVFCNVTRNTWGDVVFTWQGYKEDPRNRLYRLDIYHPERPAEIMVSYTVPGSRVYDDKITFDWPVEANIPFAVATRGDQFPWEYLRWQVTRLGDPNISSRINETIVPLDNKAFVKVVSIMGINSLMGGYFNDLSDPLDPGGTGKPGRKDVVAASTFRRTYAANAGLRDVEVMPVMTVVGSAPVNPMPFQPDFPLDNYYWNPDTKSPGPNLIEADEIVKSLGPGVVPSFFIECGPGETTGIPYAPPEDHARLVAAFKQSNVEMLQWMRENWGNPTLEMWFQGATTSWYGDPPPYDVNPIGTQLLRDAQIDMSLNYPGFKMGSFVPNANLYTTYRNEMPEFGWEHYTVEGYHAAAAEMGEAIAKNINRAYTPPDWVNLRIPTGMRVVVHLNGDIVVTWDHRPTMDNWYFINWNGDGIQKIWQGVLTTNSFTFTLADQLAAYGEPATYVTFEVAEYIPATQSIGPSALYDGDPGDSSGLRAPENLVARSALNGNVTASWTAREGVSAWYYRNRDAGDDSVISQGVIYAPNFTFTAAEQEAHYGFRTTYFVFEVAEYDAVNDAIGALAYWNDDAIAPQNPMNPPTGLKAIAVGAVGSSDIRMSWDASPTGRKFKIRNNDGGTGEPFYTAVQSETSFLFTTGMQIAQYGYTTGYVDFDVMEYDDIQDIEGPVTNYSGAPTK